MKKLFLVLGILLVVLLLLYLFKPSHDVVNSTSSTEQPSIEKVDTTVDLKFEENTPIDVVDEIKNDGSAIITNFYNDTVKHLHYSFSYAEEHEQPYWTMYTLTKTMMQNPVVKRKDEFREDPFVETGSASLKDYVGSGYDRGHLCPAKAMECSKEAMSESFYMSNMSPQHPSLNRGIWKKLEAKERKWAVDFESITVFCGGVLDSVIEYIGPNKVSVPKYYYKIIYTPNNQDKAVSFVFPNEKCSMPLESYMVSIDSIEHLTHLDFFSEYSTAEQQAFEVDNKAINWGF